MRCPGSLHRLRITGIVLVDLHKRFYQLRADQLHRMTATLEK